MNHLVSFYLTSKPDPQRGDVWQFDKFDEISDTWYESAWQHINKLSVKIFTDFSADRYDGDKFILTHPEDSPLSLNDWRYVALQYWLDGIPDDDWVLMTDISDVEFFKDPYEYMNDPDAIYIGSNDTWREKPKFHKKLYDVISKSIADEWMDNPVINPGILGGKAKTLRKFVSHFAELLNHTRAYNSNMVMANRLAYFYDYKIITGYPLHTKFKKHESADSGAYIRHK